MTIAGIFFNFVINISTEVKQSSQCTQVIFTYNSYILLQIAKKEHSKLSREKAVIFYFESIQNAQRVPGPEVLFFATNSLQY